MSDLSLSPMSHTDDSSPVHKRKSSHPRRNVTTACISCRTLRSKCDSDTPCAQCVRRETPGECRRTASDGRKFKQHATPMRSLEARITELEAQLKVAQSAPTAREFPLALTTPLHLSSGSLTLDNNGALRYSGPTSSFFRTNPADGPSLFAAFPPAVPNPDSYLPFPMPPDFHSLVVYLAFARQFAFGFLIDEVPFQQGLASLTRTNHFSPFLHLGVLATGARYISEELWTTHVTTESFADRGNTFAKAAQSYVESECADPNLATIRGLFVLTAWHVGRGRDRMAMMYHGLALALTQDFRLHIDHRPLPQGDGLADDLLDLLFDRCQVFWTAAIYDTLWCTYLGRESGLPRHFITQELPPIPTFIDTPCPPRVGHAYLARLCAIASRIVESVYVLEHTPEEQILLRDALDAELLSWFASLPPSLKVDDNTPLGSVPSHFLSNNAMFHDVVILLWRPFLFPADESPPDPAVVRRCRGAASMISLILKHQTFFGAREGVLSQQHFAHTAGGILIFFALGIIQDPDGQDVEKALSMFTDVIAFLREVSFVWENAGHSADSLEEIRRQFVTGGGKGDAAVL